MNDEEVAKASLNDWPLPEPCLAELGRIAAAWSILENTVEVYLGKLSGFQLGDQRAFILLKHAAFPQKLDILSALCAHLISSHEWLAEYKEVVGRIREAQKLRNRYMHNLIWYNAEANRLEIAVGSARGIVKTSVEPLELKDLKRASMTIHEAHQALHALVTRTKYPAMWRREGG